MTSDISPGLINPKSGCKIQEDGKTPKAQQNGSSSKYLPKTLLLCTKDVKLVYPT